MNKLVKQIIASFIGVAALALGAAICQAGNVGVDPYTAMNLGVSGSFGWSLGWYQLILNLLILAVVFLMQRSLIGIGTVINMVCTGFLIEFFIWLHGKIFHFSPGFLNATIHLIIGVILFTYGASLYMKADLGVAPYDAVALVAVERLPFSYKVCRVAQDILVVLIALLFRGPVGVATVITAFLAGPLISFFNKVNVRLLEKQGAL